MYPKKLFVCIHFNCILNIVYLVFHLTFLVISKHSYQTKESSPIPIQVKTNHHDQLYDVDTLMDDLDNEKFNLNNKTSLSTNQNDFIHRRKQLNITNRQEFMSSQKSIKS